MANQEYNGKIFEIGHTYVGDTEPRPALTGFGKTFVETGFLRGYGYVNGGTTGHFGPKAKGAGYQALREALASGDLVRIAEAAKRLPSVELRVGTSYPGNRPSNGFCVSRKGCILFEAAYLRLAE